jgi:hypothetical protein
MQQNNTYIVSCITKEIHDGVFEIFCTNQLVIAFKLNWTQTDLQTWCIKYANKM